MMAQPLHSLGYVCRNCRQALKLTRQNLQPSHEAVRTFSSGRSLSKTLATFTPTSSPELDTLLSSWRNEVFLPSILSPHHQDLVYKQSRRDILITPPGVSVTVQTSLPPSAPNASKVAEETIKLSPMNRFDRQNFTKSLNEITQELSKSPNAQAWDNLIPFLEGLRLARIEPYPHFLPRLARIASQRDVGRWNTILTAATVTKRTGMTLSHQSLTHELVIGLFQRAVEGRFLDPEPSKTLQRIIVLLDAPEHCGGRIAESTEEITHLDMRRDPTILAVEACFAATHAIRNSSAKDKDGSVAKSTQKLLTLEQANPGCLVMSAEKIEGKQQRKEVWQHNAELTALVPMYAALNLISKVNMQEVWGKQKAVKAHVEIQNLLRTTKVKIDAARQALENEGTQISKRHRTSKSSETPVTPRRGLLLLERLEASMDSLDLSQR